MNTREFAFNAIFAAISTFVSYWLGGWDIALRCLLLMMIVDYTTGFLGAIKNHTVNSEVMFWGGIRKAIILVVLAIAVNLDQMMGNADPVLRTLVIYYYVAREGVSVTENVGILGVPMPPILTNILSQLQDKGEGK